MSDMIRMMNEEADRMTGEDTLEAAVMDLTHLTEQDSARGSIAFEEEDLVSTEVARLANLCILEAAG